MRLNKLKKFDYFNLGNSFVLYYIVMFGSLTAVYFLRLPSIYIASKTTRESLLLEGPTALYLMLGLIAFIVGYKFLRVKSSWLKKRGLNATWKKVNFYWVFGFFLFGTLVTKVLAYFDGDYPFLRTGPSVLAESFRPYLGYFDLFGLVALALAFAYYFYIYKQGGSYRVWQITAWTVFVLEFAHGFVVQGTFMSLQVLLVYLVVRHYVLRKSWKQFVAAVFLSVLILMPATELYKKPNQLLSYVEKIPVGTDMDSISTKKPIFSIEAKSVYGDENIESRFNTEEYKPIITAGGSLQYIIDHTVGRFGQSGVLSSIVNKTDKFLKGKYMWRYFVSLGPPRFIWHNKPVIGFDTNEFGRSYGIINDFDMATKVGPTMVGDWYLNFGVWGIIFGLLFLGFVFRFIFDYLMLYSKNTLSGVVAYSIIWVGLIKGMENQVALVLAGTTKLLMLFIVLHFLLTVDWKSLAHKFISH